MGFAADDRGVSPVLGATLLAGFIVMALVTYQLNVVTQENEEVEFEHYLTVIEDMRELRNGIVTVAETNALEAVSVKLGTRYPGRTVGRNPPPARGTLETRTVGSGTVSVSGVNMTALCGVDDPVETSALVYEPAYEYLSGPEPIRFEGSVVHRDADGGRILESRQAIVRDTTISIAPIVGNVSMSSDGAETVDLRGERTGETTVSRSLTLTVPTTLSPETWEDDLLSEERTVTEVTRNGSAAVDIELRSDTYRIRCTPVGVNENPDASPTLAIEEGGLNPAGHPGISLRNESLHDTDDHVVIMHLNNSRATDVELQRARINHYHIDSSQRGDPTNADIADASGTVGANLEFRAGLEDLDPTITLEGNDTITDVRVEFYDDSGQSAKISEADWFAITLAFDIGDVGTYVVSVPKK